MLTNLSAYRFLHLAVFNAESNLHVNIMYYKDNELLATFAFPIGWNSEIKRRVPQ